MCGICGYISFKNEFNIEELEHSVSTLSKRGPDNQNIWTENNMGLGHARLSIIDLSEKANQPMVSASGRFVIALNGEIYNFKQIAEKYNIKTRTNSDTEIVLEAYEIAGKSILNQLNGMFAFVIYDKHTKELFIARDRMGIKPLHYFFDGKAFAFASEIKALLKIDYIKSNIKLNRSSITQFLNLGYIPEPNTFFENIKKFPAGNYGIFNKNSLTIKKYWGIEENISETTFNDFADSKSKLRELLTQSVKRRMISDVPLGTFLSGGIDSSLITALAQEISNKPVKTFTIGFKENKFNEAIYAKKVADYLKTDHHEFIVSENDVLELINDFFHAYDEPFTDSSGFPTMLVSKLARKYVTVVLSGDGGDELFHGYGAYNWAKRLNNPVVKGLRKPIASILSKHSNRSKRASELFRYQNKSQIKSHIFSQEQYLFSFPELNKLLVNEPISDINEEINAQRILTKVEEQAIFDLKYYLKDDLLTKVDRASMYYSLEARVPMLDHEVVEFAINLHPSLKIKNREQKYLLKQLLYDYVPKQYFDRPKWGFAIPLNKWLKTDLSYLLTEFLSKDIVEKYNLVKFSEIEKLKNKFYNGHDYLYNRLWALIVLHSNLKKYFDNI